MACCALALALSTLHADEPETGATTLVQTLLAAPAEQRGALLDAHARELTPALARALVIEGDRLLAGGRAPEALATFGLARDVAQHLGEPQGAARALRGQGDVLRMLGRLGEASASIEAGLALAQPLEDRALLGELTGALGLVRQAQGEWQPALELAQRSLELAQATSDRARLPRALSNVGVAYGSIGDYPHALVYFQRSLQAAEQAGDRPGMARALNNLGNLQRRTGNNSAALESLTRSLALKRALGERGGLPNTLKNLGQLESSQGQFAQAAAYYEQALALGEELGDVRVQASVLSDLGALRLAQGDLLGARTTLEMCLALFEQIGDGSGVITALTNLGEVFRRLGDFVLARERLQRARELAEASGSPLEVGATILPLSELELQAGRPELALALAQRTADLARPFQAHEDLWPALFVAGRAQRALGHSEAARAAFEESVQTIEALRAGLAGGELEQQSFLADKTGPYEALIDLWVEAGQLEPALVMAERSRARVLADVLQSGHVRVRRSLDEAERREEARLEKQIVQTNDALRQGASDPARLAELASKLQQARLEHETFLRRLYALHPQLAALRGESRPGGLELAARLVTDAHTALLEYVLTPQRAWLFVVTREAAASAPTLRAYRLAPTGTALTRLTEQFREQLARRDLGYGALARRLDEALLAPARTQLRGRTRLVLVPDGALWELPFQALRSPTGRHLLEEYALSYAPSLTVLEAMRQRRQADGQRPAGELLALANPSLGPVGAAGAAWRGAALAPLPDAEEQARSLQRLYGASAARVYVGAEAREETVKAEAGRYRMLHFATHGLLDDRSPMYSQLVLAKALPGAQEDGLLEAREVLELELHADLAVLSACETGRGRVGAGEGLVGLTWAFFVAGCPTTIASQWQVEARSTGALMLALHRALKAGAPKAVALQTAARAILARPQWRHPFYWAGFVVVGAGD